ncbi:MAG TPA: N-acetyltransferase [Candidatus Cloacimonadota bacterium]|nr:N-acetyltransferase [Candidatus Cloacimonadota bacterium]
MEIRLETPADYYAVESLTREAFWNLHVPGCDEHLLVNLLRENEIFLPKLDFVALLDEEESGEAAIVGNIMYAKAILRDLSGQDCEVISFGPVSVLPCHQGKGIGSALIRHSLEQARLQGHQAVLIYGDPAYYGRFGFRPGEELGISGEEGYYNPALQYLELVPGYLPRSGSYFILDPVYQLDEAAVAVFDRRFPGKVKEYRPSQDHFREMLALSRPRE